MANKFDVVVKELVWEFGKVGTSLLVERVLEQSTVEFDEVTSDVVGNFVIPKLYESSGFGSTEMSEDGSFDGVHNIISLGDGSFSHLVPNYGDDEEFDEAESEFVLEIVGLDDSGFDYSHLVNFLYKK